MTPETEQALLDEFKKLTSYLVKPLMEPFKNYEVSKTREVRINISCNNGSYLQTTTKITTLQDAIFGFIEDNKNFPMSIVLTPEPIEIEIPEEFKESD